MEDFTYGTVQVSGSISVIGESTIHYADSDLENPKPLGYPILGHVQYVNYEEIKIKGEKGISRYFLKRKAFFHEQEFRVVAALPEAFAEKGVGVDAEPGIAGVNVVVDLGTLIQKVLISPIAPKWFIEAVEDLLKTYGVECEVEVSALARNPQY